MSTVHRSFAKSRSLYFIKLFIGISIGFFLAIIVSENWTLLKAGEALYQYSIPTGKIIRFVLVALVTAGVITYNRYKIE